MFSVCKYDKLSEHVNLVELESVQVIVKSYLQNAYLEETMKSSQPEFHANASLSSTVLCRKYYSEQNFLIGHLTFFMLVLKVRFGYTKFMLI